MESFDRGTNSKRREPGRKTSILVVLLFVLFSGAVFALAPEARESNAPATGLPDSKDSTTVAQIEARLPSSGIAPAIVVVSRDKGPLDAQDNAAVSELAQRLTRFAKGDAKLEPVYSDDRSVALVAVPLSSSTGEEKIDAIRSAVDKALPGGLSAEVTGGPAFAADLKDVFAGADVRLLAATAFVVALLLLVTYRSPWLWLVPLVVVAVGDRVAALVVATASQVFNYDIDGSTAGITSVLVFGAGTNYALLLIARYREELRRHDDRYAAMRAAWRQAAPAILASSGTVTLALLTLSFASTPGNRALGWSAAIGIVVAVLFGLVALPAAMVLFGRKLFWPFVPRVGQDDPARTGLWSKVGRTVVGRPKTFAAGSVAFLVVLGLLGVGLNIGLTQNERFRETPESVLGQETLAKAFPAGFAEPTVVLTRPGDVATVLREIEDVDGVSTATPQSDSYEWAEINVVLDGDRGSDRAASTIERLRDKLGDTALVGGPDAEDLDAAAAASHDRTLIIPLVLAIVMVILLVLLRSIVAAIVLALTVVATYLTAMGAGWFVFERFFDFPAMDLPVPLFAFIFLVALGVDYNIFLTTRAREEAATQPIAGAMTSALAVTGGVITSAGIVLAAVFAVLGVLPLVTLTQIGVIVGIGVLLDTLVVRSVLVPALATLIGEKFWWPGHPGRRAARRTTSRLEARQEGTTAP
ncbi:MMPL family transporter [Aeromicrobium wangtongii]|uniref:MMPL family transporter n=1 Tax=Aeromicrobium wangtongii TaxID=2969247 RepID=UPI002016C8B9|nr:MMPL family transporter [Aeromicrobium wangtongii]MCL3819270.1 MMPL family transporter [Aeromicrobium wangtongii]